MGKGTKSKITCKGIGGTGEYTGNKTTENVFVQFTGCETSGLPCENSGPPNSGEIVTNALKGEVGVLKQEPLGTKAKIGVHLTPQLGGGDVVDFECAGGAVDLRVIGGLYAMVPRNVLAAVQVIPFIQAMGSQQYKEFEGGPSEQLSINANAGPFELAGLKASFRIEDQEALDVHCAPEGC
jgi:hypothetical protein